jgi:hypothetical protein
MRPPRENFDNIGNALTTVFILIIGEDWPGIMYNFARIYGDKGGFVTVYFLVVLMVGNLMLLSLFTAILLQNFDVDEGEEEDSDSEDSESEMSAIESVASSLKQRRREFKRKSMLTSQDLTFK